MRPPHIHMTLVPVCIAPLSPPTPISRHWWMLECSAGWTLPRLLLPSPRTQGKEHWQTPPHMSTTSFTASPLPSPPVLTHCCAALPRSRCHPYASATVGCMHGYCAGVSPSRDPWWYCWTEWMPALACYSHTIGCVSRAEAMAAAAASTPLEWNQQVGR